MTVKVKIPTQLRQLTAGLSELEIDEATDIRGLIQKVKQDHPAVIERIVDEHGEIRRFVNVFAGDEDVRFLEGLDTKLEGINVVSILPAVAGG